MKSVLVILGLLLQSVLAIAYPMVPDTAMTPGHLCSAQNRDFSMYRYPAKIVYCKRNVSNETKRQVYEAYGIPSEDRRNYTIDHFYPLSMGGSNDKKNLWPEHKEVKARRPNLELELFEDLAANKKSQKEVLERILAAKTHP